MLSEYPLLEMEGIMGKMLSFCMHGCIVVIAALISTCCTCSCSNHKGLSGMEWWNSILE